jgi:uncharacterized peroxidase-related enzyme
MTAPTTAAPRAAAPAMAPATPRVPYVAPDTTTGAVHALFETFQRTRGNVPNLFRAVAHRPAIVETLFAHLQAVTGPGTVPIALKELLVVCVSQFNGCEYCLASHTMLAKRAGATDKQIAQIARGEYTAFEPSWAAALTFAAETVPVGGHVSDATFTRLADHWDAAQIIEITTTCTIFAHFNRIANALRIPITR